mmetsp:Transcript_61490/g.68816  ORF Transcript_61490/g.68816 Transcript_61490/m.68816 type:complete len:80 (+) Transcript_61490:51-290(+)
MLTHSLLLIDYYQTIQCLVTTTPGGSSDRRDGGSTGEVEEEEIPMGDEEVDVIGMERKQMIVARLAATRTSFRSRLTFE